MNTLASGNISAGLGSIGSGSIDAIAHRIKQWFARLRGLLTKYHAIAKQRHALSRLTDDQLKDIGITRVDAIRESGKPFWK